MKDKLNLSSHIENYEKADGTLNLVEWKEELHRAIQNAHNKGYTVKSWEELMKPRPINYEELKDHVAEVTIASFSGTNRHVYLNALISLEDDIVSYAVSSGGPTYVTAFFVNAVEKYNELLVTNDLKDTDSEEVITLDIDYADEEDDTDISVEETSALFGDGGFQNRAGI